MHPAHTNSETFRALIEASETLACARGKQKLALPVNACHAWALEQLLRWGYRIERALVRMVLQGTDEEPSVNGHVNCSRRPVKSVPDSTKNTKVTTVFSS